MLFVTTRTDHTFAHANLDILEMDAIVQVHSIISEAFIFVLTITMNFCLLLLFFLARTKQLEHERSVERNARRSREAFASLLTL